MGTSKQNTDRIGHRLDMQHRRHSTTSAVSLRSCITSSIQTVAKPIAQPSGSREFNMDTTKLGHISSGRLYVTDKRIQWRLNPERRVQLPGWLNFKPLNRLALTAGWMALSASTTETCRQSHEPIEPTTSRTRAEAAHPKQANDRGRVVMSDMIPHPVGSAQRNPPTQPTGCVFPRDQSRLGRAFSRSWKSSISAESGIDILDWGVVAVAPFQFSRFMLQS